MPGGGPKGGRKAVVPGLTARAGYTARWHYRPEFEHCLLCGEKLKARRYLNWRKAIQMLDENVYVTSQPQLWVVREVLTDTLLAAGWLPRVDEPTLVAFLAPVKALDLPWLATVSDKQSALINALNAIWPNLPHQYCQAHYLSNAVTPLYEADEHMKTQMRKQVRAAAGPTMRQVQAQAKQGASDDTPTLIATGLAVRPPAGLDEVKAVAHAAQSRRDEATGSQDLVPPPAPAQPAPHPQTVADTSTGLSTSVRSALQGGSVVVYECQPHASPQPATPRPDTPPAAPDRQQRVDDLVAAYATRLRNVLSRSGRKPFRLAGLRLYADLLALLGLLETSLTYLPDEPRLTCFADAIRDALLTFETEYTWIAESYTWVLDISDILDQPLPEPATEPPGPRSPPPCTLNWRPIWNSWTGAPISTPPCSPSANICGR